MWDAKSKFELIKQWKGLFSRAGAVSIAVSPCSKKIAVIQWKMAIVLGIESDSPVHSHQLQGFGHITNVLFSNDGTVVIFGGRSVETFSGVIKVWKFQTNEMTNFVAHEEKTVIGIKMSPNGSKLLTLLEGEHGGEARVWNINVNQTGGAMLKLSHELETGHVENSGMSPVAFSPDGEDVMIGTEEGFLLSKIDGTDSYLYDFDHDHAKARSRVVLTVELSPDGKQVVAIQGGSIVIRPFLTVRQVEGCQRVMEEAEQMMKEAEQMMKEAEQRLREFQEMLDYIRATKEAAGRSVATGNAKST